MRLSSDEFFRFPIVARRAGKALVIDCTFPPFGQIGEGFSLHHQFKTKYMETNLTHLKASKVCTCCKIEKPLSEFGKRTANKDGHNIYCKSCQNAKLRESNARKYSAPATLPADAESKLLKDCTPRELILELKNRGYKGRLVWQPPMPQPIVINIEEFN